MVDWYLVADYNSVTTCSNTYFCMRISGGGGRGEKAIWPVPELIYFFRNLDLVSSPLLQLSCGSCQICLEPAPVPSYEVVFQTSALTDTIATVWMLASFPVAGVQAESICLGRSYVCFRSFLFVSNAGKHLPFLSFTPIDCGADIILCVSVRPFLQHQ